MAEVPPPPPPPPAWGAPPPGWPPPAGGQWAFPTQPVLPGSGRFRAQGVGQLLDAAFSLYRRNLLMIIAITAVAQVPLSLVQYLAYQLTGVSNVTTQLQQLGQQAGNGSLTPDQETQQLANLLPSFEVFILIAVVIGLLSAFVIQPLATSAITRSVSDLYLDRPTSVSMAYRAVLGRAGSIIGAGMLQFLAAFGVVVAAGAVTLLFLVAFGGSGLAILVLVIPATVAVLLLLYTRWAFVSPVIMLEDQKARPALRRSWALVTGSSWRILGIRLLVGIITGILSGIVGGIFALATAAGDVSLQLALSQLSQLIVSVVILPISLIVVVLLYYDQRIRREAFDIEMLAATL